MRCQIPKLLEAIERAFQIALLPGVSLGRGLAVACIRDQTTLAQGEFVSLFAGGLALDGEEGIEHARLELGEGADRKLDKAACHQLEQLGVNLGDHPSSSPVVLFSQVISPQIHLGVFGKAHQPIDHNLLAVDLESEAELLQDLKRAPGRLELVRRIRAASSHGAYAAQGPYLAVSIQAREREAAIVEDALLVIRSRGVEVEAKLSREDAEQVREFLEVEVLEELLGKRDGDRECALSLRDGEVLA